MSTKARRSANAADRSLPSPTFARRAAWVFAVGLWLFLFISLASFNSADAPSHMVAVHNQPAANLCGAAGAVIAYWSYFVVGMGSWVIVLCLAAYLIIAVSGRAVNQPLVRALGLVLMAAAFSSLHELLLPNVGPLSGSADCR